MILLILNLTALVVAPTPPYVVVDGNNTSGYDIDFVRETLGGTLPPIIVVPTIQDMLETVANSTNMIGVASTTITADRERQVDYTHGYEDSGPMLMTHQSDSIMDVMKRVMERSGIVLGLFILFLIFMASIFAPLVYLLETKYAPEVSIFYVYCKDKQDKVQAIKDSLILAVTWTVNTMVGTDTRHPTSKPAQMVRTFLSSIAKVIPILAIAVMTNVLAAASSTSVTSSYEDTAGLRIGTVRLTTSQYYIQENPTGANLQLFDNTDDMYEAFFTGDLDGVVYDFTVHQAQLRNRTALGLSADAALVGKVLRHESYGVVMPQNWVSAESYRQAVIKVLEDVRFMADLDAEYFETDKVGQVQQDKSIPAWFIAVVCLLGISITGLVVSMVWKTVEPRNAVFQKCVEDASDQDFSDDFEQATERLLSNDDTETGNSQKIDETVGLSRKIWWVLLQAFPSHKSGEVEMDPMEV